MTWVLGHRVCTDEGERSGNQVTPSAVGCPPLTPLTPRSKKPVREWGCEPMEKVMDVVARSGKEGAVRRNSPSPCLPYILAWAEENTM